MPTGTRVHNCVEKLKQEGKTGGSPYAICQSATGQSFATGKPLKKSFMSRSQAAAFLQSKIPILIEMALDQAWYPLHDYWIDTLDELVGRSGLYNDNAEDARQFISTLRDCTEHSNPQQSLERTVRDWVRYTINELSSDFKSLKTKGLTAKTKSFNRGQAEQVFRQKLPLLIELANDGAWDPFHDVWTDILHDIGDPFPDEAYDDVNRIRRYVDVGHETSETIQDEIRYELNYLERYWRENPQGHRTKGLTANDARQIIQAKEPLLIQIAEAGAWYALQDQLEDLISELGLDGFCNPKNGVNQIKIDIQRDRDTAVQAVQRYRWYLEICTEQYGTKSLKVKTKSMQYNFRTALAMVQDRQLDILHDYLTECAEDRGVENVAGLVDYHMRMIREVMREVPESEWPTWSASRGYPGTIIRNELADFEHTLDYHGTKSLKVKTKYS